jgi:hypothetical protein
VEEDSMSRHLAALAAAICCAVAYAQNSVTLDLTGLRIQNGLNQSRSSAPNTISPSFGYHYAVDGMVRGSGLVLGSLFPTATPLATALETLAPGSAALLTGDVYNQPGTHPVQVLNQAFSGGGTFIGINITASATFSAGIGADNVLAFSITNVTLSPAALVGSLEFVSGTATVTRIAALAGDLNLDGSVNFLDIDPFLLALFDPAGYEAAYGLGVVFTGDVNRDGALNFLDIDPFMDVLFP